MSCAMLVLSAPAASSMDFYNWMCIGLLVIGVFFVIYMSWVKPAIQIDREKKAGLKQYGWSGAWPDPEKEMNFDWWYAKGYHWHKEWKRWVPNIKLKKNQSYWGKRKYYWSEKSGRWVKERKATNKKQ